LTRFYLKIDKKVNNVKVKIKPVPSAVITSFMAVVIKVDNNDMALLLSIFIVCVKTYFSLSN